MLSNLFLTALKEKEKKKSKIVDEISNILDMDKVSVYRRLRGEIRFSVDEIGKISYDLGISLDQLLDSPFHAGSLFSLKIPYISNSLDFDLEMIEKKISFMKQIVAAKENGVTAILNSLPKTMLICYKELTRFSIFKWGHYYLDSENFKYFESVELPDTICELYQLQDRVMKQFQTTTYIWESSILYNLVKDIRYYESMGLIQRKNVLLLMDELLDLIEKLEHYAMLGSYSETGSKFDMYIASIHLDSTYMCMYSDTAFITIFKVFGIQNIISYQKDICEHVIKLISSIKEGALLISKTAEKERTVFFQQQREIINRLGDQ